jgi:hypothetical protein
MNGCGRNPSSHRPPTKILIRPVDTSLLDAVPKTTPSAPAQSVAAEASGKNAFASQLKRAADKTADTVSADATPAKAADGATPAAVNRTTPPEGEKWKPVKGHDDYAEITDGDRKGQFVNLNRGARRGDAFTVEERDGKSVHVYKKDDGTELVIPIEDDKNARAAGTRSDAKEPPKGETWAPVEGHQSYADILSGPRNGYFVNIQQGSSREGDVFHIVKKGGKEYHVYGTGDAKTMVEVGANKKKPAADATAPASTPTTTPSGAADTRDASQTTGATGGTAATPAA